MLSFGIDDEKLLEEYEAIWSYFKIEDSKNIELNALPVCDDRSIKTKIRTYDDKVYTNFRGSIVLEDDVECEFFRVISIDSLLSYQHKCYLQVYLDTCAYIIANKQITDYLDDNLVCCIMIELIKVKELTLLKVIEVKNAWFVTDDFLISDSNFNILYRMVVVIWQYLPCLDISDIAIITGKNVDYCCIIHSSSKSEAINLLKNSILEKRGCI